MHVRLCSLILTPPTTTFFFNSAKAGFTYRTWFLQYKYLLIKMCPLLYSNALRHGYLCPISFRVLYVTCVYYKCAHVRSNDTGVSS